MRVRPPEVRGRARKLIMNTKAIVEPQNAQTGVYFCEVPSDPCAIVMFGAPEASAGALRPVLPRLSGAAISPAGIRAHGNVGQRFHAEGRRIPAQRKRRRR